MMSRLIGISIIIIACGISTLGICQQTPSDAGEQDAKRDVPKPKWFLEGCISGGLFSWIIGVDFVEKAAKIPPEIVIEDVKHLLGKPPEYIQDYVNAYKSEAVRIQVKWTNYGIRTGTGLTTLILIGYLISRF